MTKLLRKLLMTDIESLYAQHHRNVYAYLLRLSGSPHLAQDLMQETFYRAIRGIATYRGDASPASWLCRIARNLYLNEVKQKRAHKPILELCDRLADPAEGPEGAALRIGQQEAIAGALDQLTEVQRTALMLRDADGLPYETIADMLGLTLANVKVTIHRARLRFRQVYQGEGE